MCRGIVNVHHRVHCCVFCSQIHPSAHLLLLRNCVSYVLSSCLPFPYPIPEKPLRSHELYLIDLRGKILLLFVVRTSLPFPELHGINVFLAVTVYLLGFEVSLDFFALCVVE
jgi:hypothetical protein